MKTVGSLILMEEIFIEMTNHSDKKEFFATFITLGNVTDINRAREDKISAKSKSDQPLVFINILI
jgi:hypothetical protein